VFFERGFTIFKKTLSMIRKGEKMSGVKGMKINRQKKGTMNVVAPTKTPTVQEKKICENCEKPIEKTAWDLGNKKYLCDPCYRVLRNTPKPTETAPEAPKPETPKKIPKPKKVTNTNDRDAVQDIIAKMNGRLNEYGYEIKSINLRKTQETKIKVSGL
jgi:hypothetical protein